MQLVWIDVHIIVLPKVRVVVELTKYTVLGGVEGAHTLIRVVAGVARTLAMLAAAHADAGASHMDIMPRDRQAAVVVIVSTHEQSDFLFTRDLGGGG